MTEYLPPITGPCATTGCDAPAVARIHVGIYTVVHVCAACYDRYRLRPVTAPPADITPNQ